MIPFENQASLTKSEEYAKQKLQSSWKHVYRASPAVLEDIGERHPQIAEQVSQKIREDTENQASSVFRPGIPDLVAFDEDGSYKFVEVKSSGDGLRHTQLKWLRDFKGINCEIWFAEHSKDYEKLDSSNLKCYSLRDQTSNSEFKVKMSDGDLLAEIPEELAAITGLEDGTSVKWRLKSKDELILEK